MEDVGKGLLLIWLHYTTKKLIFSGGFFFDLRGFHPPQINLRRFFGPLQLESPQVICRGFEQPLVSELYCGSCFMEGFNLFYC